MTERNVIVAGNHQQARYWMNRLGLTGDEYAGPESIMGRRDFDAYLVGEWWRRGDFNEADVIARGGRIVMRHDRCDTSGKEAR